MQVGHWQSRREACVLKCINQHFSTENEDLSFETMMFWGDQVVLAVRLHPLHRHLPRPQDRCKRRRSCPFVCNRAWGRCCFIRALLVLETTRRLQAALMGM